MSNYIWVVTRDHLEEEDVKVFGPWDASESDLDKCVIPFRMYDDDDTLYYEGLMSKSCEGFEPLDDFGMPNAGCTSIHVKEEGKGWSVL